MIAEPILQEELPGLAEQGPLDQPAYAVIQELRGYLRKSDNNLCDSISYASTRAWALVMRASAPTMRQRVELVVRKLSTLG